jgi:hypothetical protein
MMAIGSHACTVQLMINKREQLNTYASDIRMDILTPWLFELTLVAYTILANPYDVASQISRKYEEPTA